MDTNSTDSASDSMVVVDIGKHRGKRVRALRRGKGPLLGKVEQLIEEMKAEGQLESGAQTVVIVVERKKKRMNLGGGKLFKL